ncbi:MAG: hypothetical protein WC438_01310 [Candidatus Pacearchaeota archaeon]
MVKWACTRCNYRFESVNPKDCPYCGRDSIEKEKTAEELIDEVKDLLKD